MKAYLHHGLTLPMADDLPFYEPDDGLLKKGA